MAIDVSEGNENLQQVDWSTIPRPQDDGAAEHLTGRSVTSISLRTSDESQVNIADLDGRTIIYAYPMTARPDTPLPDGWNMIPGARGCTPQSCSFRDHMQEITSLGVQHLYGLSTQETSYQQEAASRLHLPFLLLSDYKLQLQKALNLPVMTVEGTILLKRLTMVIDDGTITKVFYPVFPPDNNAADIISWLKEHRLINRNI